MGGVEKRVCAHTALGGCAFSKGRPERKKTDNGNGDIHQESAPALHYNLAHDKGGGTLIKSWDLVKAGLEKPTTSNGRCGTGEGGGCYP